MRRFLSHVLRDQGGGPAVEFALLFTVAAALLPMLVDGGQAIRQRLRLETGARNAVAYLQNHTSDMSGLQAVVANGSGFNTAWLQVNTSQSCECSAAAASCSSTCSASDGLAHYTQVSISYNGQNEFFFGGWVNSTRSRTFKVRTQ